MKRSFLLPIVTILLVVLAGCGPDKGTGAPQATTAGGKQPAAAPAQPTAAPAGVDNGDLMPPYPGAESGTFTEEYRQQVAQSGNPLQDPQERAYRTKDAPARVVAFYTTEMSKRGWQTAINLTGDEGGLIQWQKGDLRGTMLTGVQEGQTIILLEWGTLAPPQTPAPTVYSYSEALAVAQAKAREWQPDAVPTSMQGGGAFAVPNLSPDGRGAFWQIKFYSPGAKTYRNVNVDGRSGTGKAEFAGSEFPQGEPFSLEGIIDSTEACAKAEALGASEALSKYPDMQVFVSAYADDGGIHLFVQYMSETAEKNEGIFNGYILGMELDGKTGELIRYQQKDGKPVEE